MHRMLLYFYSCLTIFPSLSVLAAPRVKKAHNSLECYLKQKGVKGFKEAIKIVKTAIPEKAPLSEKKAGAERIHKASERALEYYIANHKRNLNNYGINDKALTKLVGVATADKLADLYISNKFTYADLTAVERYIAQGGRSEEHIQHLLHML